MKFGHIADCHLGSWRLPELRELNFQSFKQALETCKKEKVDFILIAGDLFDTAYPPIETIKETFNEFRKLREAEIPVFLIAGSHDFSVSGKSFLDVLEKSGFIKNVHKQEEKDGKIFLQPTIYKNVAIYGYPGKKSGLEVYDVERLKIQESPGLFKILMLHTTLKDAIGTLPIPSVDPSTLPDVNYVALGHLHLKYEKENRVYCGPIYPNNASEIENLKYGSFYIIDTSGPVKRHEIRLKDVNVLDIEITDALTATDKLREILETEDIKDKIVILKVKGFLERGKVADINFQLLEDTARERGAYSFLKNTTKLIPLEQEMQIETNSEDLEDEVVSTYLEKNPHKFNDLANHLISVLDMDKKEDETTRIFEERLFSESNKVINS